VTQNAFAGLESFRATALAQCFREEPLGFVDIGALGGVHRVVDPIAEFVHALCFEPDPQGFEALKATYSSPKPYAGVSLERVALARDSRVERPLHVCAAPTNSSLLEPNPVFVDRYRAVQFRPSHVINVGTTTLDEVVFSGRHAARFGEFLKLDTQGSEYEVLQGASRVLRERCVAILCEVEFFEVYREQKTLADIIHLLRGHGFALYALYPHYRSSGSIDRRRLDTEERLMWADAVFFKDPLDDPKVAAHFAPRSVNALLLCALAMLFYDFALELSARFIADPAERERLADAARTRARADRDEVLAHYLRVKEEVRGSGDFLKLAEFMEAHRSNSSTERVRSATPRAGEGGA